MSCFYVDGSAKNNGYANSSGGFGVVEIENNNIIFQYQEFKSPTTNNEMELMAILYTLKLLDKNKNFCNNNFRVIPVIFTDSNYCYQIFNNWMYKWEKNNWLKSDNKEIKNLDIIKEIFKLKDLARIEKVKGHADNKWNNYADMLATGKVLLEKKG